jgi:hypothetical protein
MGPIYYITNASDQELSDLRYVILIDPGTYDELACARFWHAGDVLVRWLRTNPAAHLVVISGEVSQDRNSKGIQETYFNAIRNASQVPFTNLRPRVLTCNYDVAHDPDSFNAAQYWIQHEISTESCPTLRVGATQWPGVGWHP